MSIVHVILVVTIGLSLMAEQNINLKRKLLFNAYQIKHRNEWYRWFSHGFIHGGFFHLAINMYVFYIFGQHVESVFAQLFGQRANIYFILLYLGGIIISSSASYLKHQDNPNYNSLGASGAVASIMFAFILYAPTSPLYLMFIPIGIPAFLFGILYLWYESYMAKRGGTGIAHDAHFWGAVFGLVFIAIADTAQISDFLAEIVRYISSFVR